MTRVAAGFSPSGRLGLPPEENPKGSNTKNVQLIIAIGIYYFSPIFWSKCDTVLNHTELYEYKHGKMLMHLKFCCESIPNKPTPAAMLRYYRQRKGLTTRQLAESVCIVPAPILMYEHEKFPIA